MTTRLRRTLRRLSCLLLPAALTALLPAPAHASVYITAAGDTLATVAAATGCDPDLLLAINGGGEQEPLQAGRLLVLADGPVCRHRVSPGETLYGLARSCGVEAAELAALNGLAPPWLIYAGDTLLLPLAEEESCRPGTEEVVAAAAPLTVAHSDKGGLIWPVSGPVTSPFGEREEGFHYGLDIGVSSGTKVVAAAAGTVLAAGWLSDGYGYGVLVDHGSGAVTLYGHCSEVLTAAGQRVEQGETLARSGSTGRSTGPHLHFEVRLDGEWQDPLDYLPPEPAA
ncbi:MAG: M23 family metallopeptidase [Firmicutes bacterium]|nr:M23 family metallopeptidase [Bacillota bacterium]